MLSQELCEIMHMDSSEQCLTHGKHVVVVVAVAVVMLTRISPISTY